MALSLLMAAILPVSACQTTFRPDCPACAEAVSSDPGSSGSGSAPPPPATTPPCNPYATSELDLLSIGDPNLLFLSGGGAHGAWGAGVLVGWQGRPAFDVVTGISTGALQAPLVFLDSPEADAKLEELYTTTTNGMVYAWNWQAMFFDGLQSRAPLRALIDDHMDDAQVELVAAASVKRELWVGTVNMDTSGFCPWNLSTIAKDAVSAKYGSPADPEKAACLFDLYREVIFAASGAPVLAPPVLIDGDFCDKLGTPEEEPIPNREMHVDGGTRLRVFAQDTLAPALSGSGTRSAWVIMNGKLVLHGQCIVNTLSTIAMRAFDIILAENVFGSLHYLKDQLGSSYELHLSRIPLDYCLYFGTGTFEPAQMTALFQAGKTWSQTPSNWEHKIPEERYVPRPEICDGSILDCQDCGW